MSSSRLPGKVMMKLCGKTMLEVLTDRLKKVDDIDKIVVATSDNKSDNPIEKECLSLNVECYRGSLDNVLERYLLAAKKHNASTVVRITADCPLIDPIVVTKAIRLFNSFDHEYSLVTNRMPLTFPDGMDVDVMSIDSLKYAHLNSSTQEQREHVIPFFYEEKLKIFNFELKERLFTKIRLTLDYKEDYEVLSSLTSSYGINIDLNNIYKIWKKEPELFVLNKNFIPKNYYTQFDKKNDFLQRTQVYTYENKCLSAL
jgi:spore coat polysaccharide biosynthesis protein SpsF